MMISALFYRAARRGHQKRPYPACRRWATSCGTLTIFFEEFEEAGVPANPHLEKRAAQAAHVVVDGVLRFFHKIEYDHTLFKRRSR